MKNFLNLFLILIVTGLLSACQTPVHKAVTQVKKGMDKSDVIDLLGSPKYTKYGAKYDHWKYVFYKDDIKMSKEILFLNDHVVRVKRTVKRPELLEHAMAADSMSEYEYRMDKYKEAQKIN